jgi:hypothetical protein
VDNVILTDFESEFNGEYVYQGKQNGNTYYVKDGIYFLIYHSSYGPFDFAESYWLIKKFQLPGSIPIEIPFYRNRSNSPVAPYYDLRITSQDGVYTGGEVTYEYSSSSSSSSSSLGYSTSSSSSLGYSTSSSSSLGYSTSSSSSSSSSSSLGYSTSSSSSLGYSTSSSSSLGYSTSSSSSFEEILGIGTMAIGSTFVIG